MDKKKIILIIAPIVILGAIIFTTITIINNNKKEKNEVDKIDVIKTKTNLDDINVDKLKVTNQALLKRNDISYYNANVVNNSNADYHIDYLYVTFTIENETKKVLALYDTTIKANEKTNVSITFDSDISKVSKISYSIEKK